LLPYQQTYFFLSSFTDQFAEAFALLKSSIDDSVAQGLHAIVGFACEDAMKPKLRGAGACIGKIENCKIISFIKKIASLLSPRLSSSLI